MIIYALQDPRSGKVRYVGKTSDLRVRYNLHTSDWHLNQFKTKKNSWIKSLKAKGFMPVVTVLDEVEDEQANEAEIAYIEFFGPENLTNGTLGGDGGVVSDPEAKERIRQAHLGSKRSEDTKKLMSDSHRKRCESPEERKRMSETAIKAGNKPPVMKGESNPKAKLKEEDVKFIRLMVSNGFSPREIWEQEFPEFTYQNIWMVANGKTWKHITS